MTCIAGVVDNGTVWIGGDSAACTNWTAMPRADQKVFVRGPWIFGVAGCYRVRDVLRYRIALPEPPQSGLSKFMAVKFVDALRRALLQVGGMSKEHELEEHEGIFLVGCAGRLFSVEGNFQVGGPHKDHWATGCGDEIAVGSLYSSKGFRLTAKERIKLALDAASQYSAFVKPPYTIRKLEPK